VKSGQRGEGPKSCSHGCLYCYNPPGTQEGPVLKDNVLERLKTDLKKLKGIIKPNERVEFTFVGDLYDPTLPDYVAVNCLRACKEAGIPFQVLTKNGKNARADFGLYGPDDLFGVTLTCDNDFDSLKWEPGASLWSDRIEALREAHVRGIKTWVSFEPVVDPKQTLCLIELVAPFADKIKVGKMNSKNNQPWHSDEIKKISQETDWAAFAEDAVKLLKSLGKEFYIKDDLRKFIVDEYKSSTSTRQELRRAALDYAKRGWKVVPLYNNLSDRSCGCGNADCNGNSRGKHPRLKEWQNKASDDPKKIEYWWGMWPQSNVGVMCGQDTGFMVVDVDPGSEESLKGREWPKTHKVKTGRGYHYHFKWPKLDFELKNNAGILPGVDIKVGRGQAVMPPSTHYNGGKYEWEVSPEECELAEAPAWFVEILKEKYAPKKRLEENITKLDKSKKSAINDRYWQKALEEETGAVAMANEGERNNQLNTSAFKLAGIVASGNLDEWDVRKQLERAARRAGLNETEIEKTLNSALGAGKAHPRDDPKPAIEAETRHEPKISNPVVDDAETNPCITMGSNLIINIEETLEALRIFNNPVTIFQRAGELVRVKSIAEDQFKIEEISDYALRNEMGRAATFEKFAGPKAGYIECTPSMDLARSILALGEWDFPRITGLTNAPAVRADGSLLIEPGYDKATGLYYVPDQSLEVPEIKLSKEDAEVAAKHILDEVLHDFPFIDDASRANMLAGFLTPIIRPMIRGCVPILLVDKPSPGTGASKLLDLISLVATGREMAALTPPNDEDEWRKLITGVMRDGSPITCWDNIAADLEAATLARALSSSIWKDRTLGKPDATEYPQRTCWYATGNNLTLAGDIPRRGFLSQLDAKMARPWERKAAAFRHSDINKWVRENRGRLLADLLTMAASWVMAGRPRGPEKIIGGFDEWVEITGGILNYAEVPDFLGNLEKLYEEVDVGNDEWADFLQAWKELHDKKLKSTAEILEDMRNPYCSLSKCIPTEISKKIEYKGPGDAKKVGIILRKKLNVRYKNNLMLAQEIDKHNKIKLWIVKEAKDNAIAT
jgi:DNA repair photolyase